MSKLAGDHVQVLVDGYELTGDHNSITIDDRRSELDVTTFGDGAHNFILGSRQSRLEHAGFMNAAAARSHPVLRGGVTAAVVSVLLGQNTAPVAGDPMYSLAVGQVQYQSGLPVGEAASFAASFAPKGQAGGWGQVLAAPVDFTDSGSGSGVDNGAASSNGGAAFLHVLTAAASDSYTLTVEGSATGAFAGEESTLATFTLDGSAVGSERVAISGSIPQHTRWKAVRTGSAGDTVTIAVNLVRF